MNITAIQSLETRLIEAMKASNVQELDNLISDGLIFTAHNGMMFTKQDDLSAHSSGNIEIFEINTSEQVIKIMDDVAIVSVLMEISGNYFPFPVFRLPYSGKTKKTDFGIPEK